MGAEKNYLKEDDLCVDLVVEKIEEGISHWSKEAATALQPLTKVIAMSKVDMLHNLLLWIRDERLNLLIQKMSAPIKDSDNINKS